MLLSASFLKTNGTKVSNKSLFANYKNALSQAVLHLHTKSLHTKTRGLTELYEHHVAFERVCSIRGVARIPEHGGRAEGASR